MKFVQRRGNQRNKLTDQIHIQKILKRGEQNEHFERTAQGENESEKNDKHDIQKHKGESQVFYLFLFRNNREGYIYK